ncbi:MAG: AAA family ATPase [Actinomycetota bacterium]|nr:AAA family ATPase [Actinomycetota bacterium]
MVETAMSSPLGSRAAILRRLDGAIGAAARGRAAFIVVEGEPGIGKSWLLDAACKLAQRAEFTVRRGQGEELERERPFGLIADALDLGSASDPERTRIAGVLARGGGTELAGTSADLRFQLIESMCDLVEREAETRPVAVAVDDVQWADPSSLLALYRLSRRVAYLPFVLLLGCRPLPRSRELARLVNILLELDCVHVSLPPLSHEEAVELAAQTAGAAGVGSKLEAHLRVTGGNPLFVRELVQTLVDEGAAELLDDVVEIDRRPQLSPSLRHTILRRMSSLPEETLDVLKVASVLGTTFALADLTTVTRQSPATLVGHLTDAVGAGFVHDLGGRFAFRHDLVREVLYVELLPTLRTSLHLDAARSLAAAGSSPGQVAAHFSLSAAHGDAEAVAWLTRAARELVGHAPTVAIELFERALELAPLSDPIRVDLNVGLIRPLVWTGELGRAEAVARELLAGADDSSVTGHAALALGSLYFLQYRLREMSELCTKRLAVEGLGAAERAHFLALAVMPEVASGELRRALTFAEEAFRTGREIGRISAVPIENTRGIVARLEGRYMEAVASGRRAIAAAQSALMHDPDLGVSPRLILANAHVFQSWNLIAADRIEEAARLLRSSMQEYERIGAVAYVNLCHRGLAYGAFLSGRWDDADAELESLRYLVEETQAQGLDTHQPDPWPLLALHQGRMTEASLALERLEQALPPERWRRGNLWFLPLKAEVLEAGGDAEAALDLLATQLRQAKEIGAVPDFRIFGRSLVRLSLDHDQRDLAERVVSGAAELASRGGGIATVDGISLLCRGLLEDDPDTLLDAVAAYREGPRPFDLAAACEEAGESRARHGFQDDGVKLLREASEIHATLGATRDEVRISHRLRALGVKTGARGPRGRPLTGWGSLTAAEQRVARLVPEGLTNTEIGARLFISGRTVSTHLAHIFRKLEISSRSELAAIATRESRGFF